MDINHNSSTCSYKGQVLEWSASETLYRAYCTLSTQSIKVNYVHIPPTDAAPHFLLKLTPLFRASIIISVNPLTPMSDQDRISPYSINTISSRQIIRIIENIN